MSASTDPVYHSTVTTPDGDQVAKAPLTPADDQRDKIILAKPPEVIPVLFIPGIMGSNLKKKNGSVAWRPPNLDARGAADAIAQLFEYLFKSTIKRAKELNTEEAQIDPRGPIDAGSSALNENILRARRWGTVLRSSYHPFMGKLQNHLNNLSRFIPAAGKAEWQGWAAGDGQDEPTQWGAPQGAALTPEEFKHAANYQFDVWAGGYNWLQGNRDSGEAIRDYIEQVILPFYNEGKAVEVQGGGEQPNRIQRAKPVRPLAEKVIVVTHSMGGLVSRSLTEIHCCDKVLGVVHGVQPATGAPDTYKRMRAGADGIAQLFLGRNAADLTAILTQAQGGMELLPTADYNGGRPWLKARDQAAPPGEDWGDGLSLPLNGDPYEDIYKSDKWYGLVPKNNEKLMNPAGTAENEGAGSGGDMSGGRNPRGPLEDLIDKVKQFHDDIRGKYKAPTYVFYGAQGARDPEKDKGGLFADKNRFSFGQVVWEGRGGGQIQANAAIADDDQNGEIELTNGVKLRIAKADAPGDGTVPWQSGIAPEDKSGVEMVFSHGHQGRSCEHNQKFGYDHQDAYNDERALYATLYAIVKIAQSAQWHKKKESQ